METGLLILLTAIYLAGFIRRNLLVQKKTNQKVRSKEGLTILSIVMSTLCFVIVILSTSQSFYALTGSIPFLRSDFISGIGFILFTASIILGWYISAQLKESWRVGVHEDQKTQLISSGIYAHVRNPYFNTYFLMFLSFFLIQPSILLGFLVLATCMTFHKMVLREETYLEKVHGKDYLSYKAKTGRYMPGL
ncbi:MAG: isoprenylcysteine carboxylmethyltransferase family protein [Desulfobacteraceae bacterium]|nr:isoprenylcysteine carboxylmethyltransferase family protein [Desulfobacteraceae bacterium]